MNNKDENLFEPYTFPSGVTVNNRLVMAPMTTWSGFENGMITSDELAYYNERSGGVGAVITACAYVSYEGKAFAGGIGADSDRLIPSLAKLAKSIQDQGSKAILQIFHGGRMVSPATIGGQTPVSASAVAALRENAATPRELTTAEVENLVTAFGEATHRAIEAGFDGVEIHGANTYLIQQFFSPHSNRRTDKWGGTIEKRMNFPLAVVDSVLSAVKNHAKQPFLVGYRLSPEEIEEPGITIADTLQLIDRLSEKDLDYIHLSTFDIKQSSRRNPEDPTPLIDYVIKQIGDKKPLIGVGSIQDADDASAARDKGLSFIALGRALIQDPKWVQKVQNGEEKTIRQELRNGTAEELKIPAPMWDIAIPLFFTVK